MWNQLFPNGFFPSKQNLNENLQKRISGLFSQTKDVVKDCSPTLLELQRQKNKVKRLSSVYEDKNASEKDVEWQKPMQKTTSEINITVPEKPCKPEPKAPLSTNDENIRKLIAGLIKIDKAFIEHMKLLIDVYVKGFENNPALRRRYETFMSSQQKSDIFGGLEAIYNFHKDKFHPMIESSANDPEWLAKNITKFIREHRFEPYFLHALDERDSQYRREVYYKFYIKELNSKSGVTYKFSPIEQLSRYHNVLKNILREAEKKSDRKIYNSFCAAEAELRSILAYIRKMSYMISNLDSMKK